MQVRSVPLPPRHHHGVSRGGSASPPPNFSPLQSSESVSLELLTYADLETLRSRKVGAITRPPASAASLLSAKRYLILVYSVEFDR